MQARTEPRAGITATAGPGLIGGVMVGLVTAKALAMAGDKPLLAVNHLEGHLLSPFVGEEEVIAEVGAASDGAFLQPGARLGAVEPSALWSTTNTPGAPRPLASRTNRK